MTILITGGAGFIGSSFVKHLLATDKVCKVIILDALTYAGNLDNLKDYINNKNILIPENHSFINNITFSWQAKVQDKLPSCPFTKRWKNKLKGYHHQNIANNRLSKTAKQILRKYSDNRLLFVVGFIEDCSVVEQLLDLSDYIINFAAQTHVDRAVLNPDDFIKTDIYGTFNLLKAMRQNKKVKRLIHVSTDEVYGNKDKGSNLETDPLNPTNPYSASKAAAEKLILAYENTYNIKINIVRPSNTFGPFQHPEKFLPTMIIRALEKQSLPVYGDGNQVRDWIYIDDLVKAIKLVFKKAEAGQIYNIAGRNQCENIDLVNYILIHLKKNKDQITYIKDRPGHDRRYSMNDDKIRKGLGFNTQNNFYNMIDHTIDWYVNNKKWWKKIIKSDPEYKSFCKELYGK